MRLLIVLPSQQEATGNFVTARRLQAELQAFDITVELLAIDQENAGTLSTAIDQFCPDHLLLLNAWRTGRFWLESSALDGCPATILLTGTDINRDITDLTKGPVIEQVLQHATAIISQNRQTVDSLRKQKPPWIKRLHHIPPGVSLGQARYPLRKSHGIAADRRLFLHPAGIRPVKANLELLKLCDPLAKNNSNFAVAFCGPALDPDYFATFIAAIDQRPWAHYLGILPPEAMASAMDEADLILNHSLSEGISNALIEAITVGRPVLARNIPGNAALQTSDSTLHLYASDAEFIDKAQQFLSDFPSKKSPCAMIFNGFSAKAEAANFFTLFKSLA